MSQFLKREVVERAVAGRASPEEMRAVLNEFDRLERIENMYREMIEAVSSFAKVLRWVTE